MDYSTQVAISRSGEAVASTGGDLDIIAGIIKVQLHRRAADSLLLSYDDRGNLIDSVNEVRAVHIVHRRRARS